MGSVPVPAGATQEDVGDIGQPKPPRQPAQPPPLTTPSPTPTPTQTPTTVAPQSPAGSVPIPAGATQEAETDTKIAAQPPSALHRFGESFLSGMGITSNEQAKTFFEHPINTLIDSFQRQGQLALDARDAYRKGDYASAVIHGLNYLVPFIGQQTDVAGRQLQKGDIAGGIGTTLGVGTTLAAGAPEARGAVGSAVRGAGQAAKAGAAAARAAAPEAIGAGVGGAVGATLGEPLGGASVGALLGRTAGRTFMEKLTKQAPAPSAEAQAALEATTPTPEEVQAHTQSGIRSVLTNAANEEQVSPPGSQGLLRDSAGEVSAGMAAKSKGLFQQIDDVTDGEYTKIDLALKDINQKLLSPAAADPKVEFALLEKQTALRVRMDETIELAKSKNVDPGVVTQARAAWKKMSALDDLDIELKKSMPGNLQVRGETVDTGSFANRMQNLRDSGRLKEALGDAQAKAMLDHAYKSHAMATEKPPVPEPTGPTTTTEAPTPKGKTVPAAVLGSLESEEKKSQQAEPQETEPEDSGEVASDEQIQTNLTNAKPGSYETKLSPQEEQQYKAWLKQNNVHETPKVYDMPGFWKGLQTGDPEAKQALNPSDQTMHFPDKWKTPYHSKFSNESMYATENAPHWEGSDEKGWKLVDKSGRVVADEGPPKTNAGAPETTKIWNSFSGDDGLNRLADHLIQMEGGWKESRVLKENNNPGNLVDPTSGKLRKFSSVEEGRKALIDQLKRWRNEYPNWSVADLNRRYAPDQSHGGDNPDGTEAGRNEYLMKAISKP